MSESGLTAERVRELFDYDQSTGVLRWRVHMKNSRVAAGQVAGWKTTRGYIQVWLNRRHHKAHRLIWLHVHGVWPPAHIDHRDGDTSNNRLDNLRLANGTQNQANQRRGRGNTSGFKGVSWHRQKGKWQALIKFNGKKQHLGYHLTAELAHAAYVAAARKHFGEFARAA